MRISVRMNELMDGSSRASFQGKGRMRHIFGICGARTGRVLVCMTGLGIMLSGCSGSEVVRAFGMHRTMPDEYTVTTRAPLSMPPSEKLALPGAESANHPDQSPRMQALETLSPDIALHPVEGSPSSGQTRLVDEAAQAAHAPDNAELGDSEAGFVDSLMFWQGGRAGSVVDADAENLRLQRNSALGEKIDNGATPTASPR